MKTKTFTLGVATLAVMLSGCVTQDGNPDRAGTGTLLGALLGATSGALIGGSSHHGGEGAVIGGAIGAIAGGLMGDAMDQDQRDRLRRSAPETYQRMDRGQPLSIADIKSLSRARISDDIIISQIANTQASYRLSTADIIDLSDSGVSDRVIKYMINSTIVVVTTPEPPPPPRVERVIVAAPGPSFVWVSGEWVWNDRWVWMEGHWGYPPQPRAVWVVGHWERSGPNRMTHVPGHWR